MRKHFFYIGLLIVCFCFYIPSLFCQTEVINTYTDKSLQKFERINNTIFLQATSDFLAKYVIDGDSLEFLAPPNYLGYSLRKINTVNEDTLFTYTEIPFERSTVLKSVDGGYSWNVVYDSIGDPYSFIHIFMQDSHVGLLIGLSVILKTTDGGYTWQQQGTSISFPISAETNGNLICISDLETTILINYELNIISGDYTPRGNKFHFLNEDTILSVGSKMGYCDGGFFYTFDGGQNWSNLICTNRTEQTYLQARGVDYVQNTVYTVGFNPYTEHGMIAKSDDFGENWTFYETEFGGLNDIEFINDSIALICGINGTLFKWNKNQATPLILSTPSNLPETSVAVYPNPVTDVLNVETENPQTTCYLLDCLGNKLAVSIKAKQANDVSLLSPGMYFLAIEDKNSKEVVFRKILKE